MDRRAQRDPRRPGACMHAPPVRCCGREAGACMLGTRRRHAGGIWPLPRSTQLGTTAAETGAAKCHLCHRSSSSRRYSKPCARAQVWRCALAATQLHARTPGGPPCMSSFPALCMRVLSESCLVKSTEEQYSTRGTPHFWLLLAVGRRCTAVRCRRKRPATQRHPEPRRPSAGHAASGRGADHAAPRL